MKFDETLQNLKNIDVVQLLKDNVKLKKLKRDYNLDYVDKSLSVDKKIALCEQYNLIIETITEFSKLDGNIEGYEDKKKEIENKIINLIKNVPELMYVQSRLELNENGEYIDQLTLSSIASKSLKFGFDDLFEFIYEDERARRMQDHMDKNMGMLAFDAKKYHLIPKSLEDPIASTQQDWSGLNLGMQCSINKLYDLVMIAYKNPEATRQQSSLNFNMAMFFAKHMPLDNKYVDFIKMASQDEIVRHQTNCYNSTLLDIAHDRLVAENRQDLLKKLETIFQVIDDKSIEIPNNIEFGTM